MSRVAAMVCAAMLVLPGIPALASTCHDDPANYAQVDIGASQSDVTRDHLPWREQFIQALYREGNAHSYYVRAASDSRFGFTDPNYEGGTYQALGRDVIANIVAGYSPTHIELPSSELGGGLDVRLAHGFGLQAQYTDRSYTGENVGLTAVGADRYAGDTHVALTLTSAVLSGVPGIALSERLGYQRRLWCSDDFALVVAAGRDVEPTGVGNALAVYQAYTYDAQDTHWMSARTAWQFGVGWDPLVGAYSRFEIRLGLRERF